MEDGTVRKGYVYYNDSYEWTEMKKDLPSTGAATPQQTTTLSTAPTKTEASGTIYEQPSTDDPEKPLRWSELCNMYVSAEEKKNRKGHGMNKKATGSKEDKGKASKDNKTREDSNGTAKFMYGWNDTGNGEQRGNDETNKSTNDVDNVENLYAKVNKKKSMDK